MKTIIYVDGFNLYYGSLKGTPYKWLDILQLCQQLLPNHQIFRIKYFTARVTGRAKDPDQPNRQQIYLRALRTLPDLEIIYGHFLEHEVMMPAASPAPGAPAYVKVIKTEEKGSDVNIAAHLINDGYRGFYQAAVIISNDSDLVEPIRMVRRELNLPVGVLNPYPKTPSSELRRAASFVKPIRTGALAASQFDANLTDRYGKFTKPPTW
jgi:hypothetical protein